MLLLDPLERVDEPCGQVRARRIGQRLVVAVGELQVVALGVARTGGVDADHEHRPGTPGACAVPRWIVSAERADTSPMRGSLRSAIPA